MLSGNDEIGSFSALSEAVAGERRVGEAKCCDEAHTVLH